MEPEGSLPQSQVPAPVPILSQLDPVLTTTSHILKIHLSLGLPSGLFPSGFLTKTLYTSLLSPIRATSPAHLIRLDFTTSTILGEQYRSLSSSLCSFIHFPVTSSLLGQNILLNTLFSNTLSLQSSFWATKFHIHTKQQRFLPMHASKKFKISSTRLFRITIRRQISFLHLLFEM